MAAKIDCDRLFSGKLKARTSLRCSSLSMETLLFGKNVFGNPSAWRKSFNVLSLAIFFAWNGYLSLVFFHK